MRMPFAVCLPYVPCACPPQPPSPTHPSITITHQAAACRMQGGVGVRVSHGQEKQEERWQSNGRAMAEPLALHPTRRWCLSERVMVTTSNSSLSPVSHQLRGVPEERGIHPDAHVVLAELREGRGLERSLWTGCAVAGGGVGRRLLGVVGGGVGIRPRQTSAWRWREHRGRACKSEASESFRAVSRAIHSLLLARAAARSCCCAFVLLLARVLLRDFFSVIVRVGVVPWCCSHLHGGVGGLSHGRRERGSVDAGAAWDGAGVG
jgi:hypothetical protein